MVTGEKRKLQTSWARALLGACWNRSPKISKKTAIGSFVSFSHPCSSVCIRGPIGFHHSASLRASRSLQHLIRVSLVLPLLASNAILKRFPSLGARHAAAGFDGPGDLARDSGRQLHKLAERPFESEAVLVLAARWIWPESGNVSPILNFNCFRAPLLWRSVALRRNPPLDVPAIVGRVLWFETHFHHFAQQLAAVIAVFPFPANPVQPRPPPNRAVIRLAEAIAAARESKFPRDLRRRIVSFSNNSDHGVSSTGFSLCSFGVLSRWEPHRLKPVLLGINQAIITMLSDPGPQFHFGLE